MQANESNAVNGSDEAEVSSGTIVAAPDGERWVVIDPCNLDDDLPTEEYHWLGSVSDDESRGIGAETFKNEDWEVLD